MTIFRFAILLALTATAACAAPMSAEDASASEQEVGKSSRVAFPGSPFERDACTGAPIDEAGLAKKLGRRTSRKVGRFVYGIQHREADWTWTGRRWDASYRWVDAPNDRLTAWRDDGVHRDRAPSVSFSREGDVEVFRDAEGVHLRLVGESAPMPGPDTTQDMRLVFGPMQPWKVPGSPVGVEPSLEQTTDDGATWSRPGYGWHVETSAYEVASYHRVFVFKANDAVSIVTDRCGQIVSGRTLGGLSPISASVAIFFAFD